MEEMTFDGVTLAVEAAGTGEPVVFIHGALIADAFLPLISEPALSGSYRLVAYRRRGYEASSPVSGVLSVADHARDCRRLIRHLGLRRAHVVGHSFGGAVALQLAMDSVDIVQSVALLEPALMVGGSGQAYRESLQSGIEQFRSTDPATAVDTMLGARWPGYREGLEAVLPGAAAQAVEDSAASFESEVPALLEWAFGDREAGTVDQPVLSVVGERSVDLSPRFEEVHLWLLASLKHAEPYVLPDAHHFLQMENPREMAAALRDFLARHPMEDE